MGPPRKLAWKAKAAEETVDEIYDTLTGACPSMFMKVNLVYIAATRTCKGIYTSDDMRKYSGFDEDCLTKWKCTVTAPLLKLDPRGGFFAQQDMVQAIRRHSDDEKNNTHVRASCAEMDELDANALNKATHRGRMN